MERCENDKAKGVHFKIKLDAIPKCTKGRYVKNMGKKTKIEYICDRCGKTIDESYGNTFSIGRFKFMHVFKWWCPMPVNEYKLHYVCGDCFRSFKKWYTKKETIDSPQNQPTKKVGHWILGETMGHSWMKCSNCCVSQSGQTSCFSYCPNCGASMNEEVETQNDD